MPDDRLFHKRLGHSAKVHTLTDFEYIVWHAYVLSADDFGVMRFSAITLQADHDRLARKPQKAVMKALEHVADAQLIVRFDHQARVYCAQHDWQDFQKVKHPRSTIHPMPPAELVATFTTETRELFTHWPGKRREKIPNGFGNVSETFVHLAGAEARETANANGSRLTAGVSEGGTGETAKVPLSAPDARSKRPIYKGQRFVVFEWMLDDLSKLLGRHFESFDLHGWFDELDRRAVAQDELVPQRDGGSWLQAKTLAEATRRGLVLDRGMAVGKTAGNMAAAARFVARGQR